MIELTEAVELLAPTIVRQQTVTITQLVITRQQTVTVLEDIAP